MKVLITTSKHRGSFQLAILLKTDEVLFGDHFPDFPPANSNSLAHQILTFCLDHQIQKLFPLQFEEVLELRKSLVLFEEFGIEIMLGADEVTDFNRYDKEATSYTELTSSLIALGYPNQKIAIANADGRGELILIDDTVSDNLQVWNHVNSMNFNQVGKWFNQANFQPVFLYQLNDALQAFFILIDGNDLTATNTFSVAILESMKALIKDKKLKGFYHVSFANQQVLRIVNTTL